MSAASTKICAIYHAHAFVQMVQQITVIKSKYHHGTSAALGAQAQLHHDTCFGGTAYLVHAARLAQRQSTPMCRTMAYMKNGLGMEITICGQINE